MVSSPRKIHHARTTGGDKTASAGDRALWLAIRSTAPSAVCAVASRAVVRVREAWRESVPVYRRPRLVGQRQHAVAVRVVLVAHVRV